MLAPTPAPPYQAIWDSLEETHLPERVAELERLLVNLWLDAYELSCPTGACFDFVQRDTYMYVHDTRGEQEDFDYRTMVDDRVVCVYGTTRDVPGVRDSYNMRGPLSKYEIGASAGEFLFDRGHYVAHSLGGHEDMGLFAQRRDVNRGREETGKRFQAMERYGRKNPGSFLFSRPIYGDNTCHPFWLEYGVLKSDGVFWVETFPNRYTFRPFRGPEDFPEWYRQWIDRARAREERRQARHARRLQRARTEAPDDGAGYHP